MLLTALKAKLPVIHCTTRDPVHATEVLKSLIGKTKLNLFDPAKGISPNHAIHYAINADGNGLTVDLFKKLQKADGSTLVLINGKPGPLAFQAGELPIPRHLIFNEMSEVAATGAEAEALTSALGGCTIKEAVELAHLTMAAEGGLTVAGLLKTRRSFFQGQSGLTLVDTGQDYYEPLPELAAYVQAEKGFFLNEPDHRLRARGVLFDGPPGVGKTAGAKFLCNEWGIPLYRIDLGGTKGRYHGESEGNMLANLQRLDAEEPCAVLFDEIEKVMKKPDKSHDEVGQVMQSQLLWWLAEHRSRVLTIMTTNDVTAIPDELHREGRIDKTITFEGLELHAGVTFMVHVLNTFPDDMHIDQETLEQMFKTARGSDVAVPWASQAALTAQAYKFVKTIKAK